MLHKATASAQSDEKEKHICGFGVWKLSQEVDHTARSRVFSRNQCYKHPATTVVAELTAS